MAMKKKPGPKPGPKPVVKGIQCSRCGCAHFPVQYTRKRGFGRIVRVRVCRHCGRRITTVEKEAGT